MIVCIDTCVLLQAAKAGHPFHVIFDAWFQRRFRWAVSNDILTEYQEIIVLLSRSLPKRMPSPDRGRRIRVVPASKMVGLIAHVIASADGWVGEVSAVKFTMPQRRWWNSRPRRHRHDPPTRAGFASDARARLRRALKRILPKRRPDAKL
jgi:hypothetical protein